MLDVPAKCVMLTLLPLYLLWYNWLQWQAGNVKMKVYDREEPLTLSNGRGFRKTLLCSEKNMSMITLGVSFNLILIQLA